MPWKKSAQFQNLWLRISAGSLCRVHGTCSITQMGLLQNEVTSTLDRDWKLLPVSSRCRTRNTEVYEIYEICNTKQSRWGVCRGTGTHGCSRLACSQHGMPVRWRSNRGHSQARVAFLGWIFLLFWWGVNHHCFLQKQSKSQVSLVTLHLFSQTLVAFQK